MWLLMLVVCIYNSISSLTFTDLKFPRSRDLKSRYFMGWDKPPPRPSCCIQTALTESSRKAEQGRIEGI